MNNPKISFDAYSISTNKYVNYLDMLISNQLLGQHHTDFVVNKLCIAFGVFDKLEYYVPQHVLVQVYYGTVYPYLQYAVLIWGCTVKEYLKQIQVMQNKIVKILIIFKPNKLKANISLLYNHFKLLKLVKIHNFKDTKFMYKMKERSLPNIFTNCF